MARARRVYRLSIALAAVGAAASMLALGVAVSLVEVRAPSIAELVSACGRVVSADVGGASALVLALATLGLAVLALGTSSLARRVRANRRYLGELPRTGELEIAGTAVSLFPSDRAEAFCAGCARPRVHVSTGAVELLDRDQLEAVVAHERHHRERRDPLRLLMASVLADALFFLPVLRRLNSRYAALSELAADEAAVRAKDPKTLASALLAFGESKAAGAVVGIAPERVDHLLGRRSRWELPVTLLAGAGVAVGGVLALALLAASVAGRGSVDVVMLLTHLCTALVAALPLLAGALALRLLRPPLLRRIGA